MQIDSSMALLNASRTPDARLSGDDARLKEKADDFESIILKQMLDIAMNDERSTLFPKSAGHKIYQSMYNDTMSQSLSGGFGFSQMLFDFLSKKN